MFVHGPEIRQEALRLVGEGVNDCEIARRLGVPRSTVRDWRRPTYVPTRPREAVQTCPRCWRSCVPITAGADDYAELLGLYLGDGHITQMARAQRLRIFLDARYVEIVDETEALLRRCFPNNRVGRVLAHEGRMVTLWLYHSHLGCLFPQHGAGKKHERSIALEPWQIALIELAPFAFLRGCIRSDGCVFVNRTGPYEYLSYQFANYSQDILDLFVMACGFAGLDCRPTARYVRINRRESVARLLEHVPRKR
jgi:Homeodomain-like domain